MLKQMVPWPAKIAAKLAPSRLPAPDSPWKRPSLFEHGCMDGPALLFAGAGFVLEAEQVDRWPDLPTPGRKRAGPFRSLPDDALCISGAQAVPRPTAPARVDGDRAA